MDFGASTKETPYLVHEPDPGPEKKKILLYL